MSFELFPVVVVDFMHEFELGMVKYMLRHLVRILYCTGPGSIALLNKRYTAGYRIRTN